MPSQADTFLASLVPLVRSRGYKGSGSTFRKHEGDTLFVVNFQRSTDGEHFFINLGGQPTRIPDEGSRAPNPKTLKVYECVFSTRVGSRWTRTLRSEELMDARAELGQSLANFEFTVLTVAEQIPRGPAADLLSALPFGCTSARGALHLARLSTLLGEYDKCRAFVQLGLTMAGPHAGGFVAELKKVDRAAASAK